MEYAYDITLCGVEDATSSDNRYVTDLVIVYALNMDGTVGRHRDDTHVFAR
jgi:hypothetical protein